MTRPTKKKQATQTIAPTSKAAAPRLPKRGEIWMAELNPVVGREQAGQRPVLVLSSDAFNASPAELVSILPVTTRERPIPTRIELKAGEGGLPRRSFVITEQVGTVSIHRLRHRLGTVPAVALEGVADAVRVFLDL